MWPWTRHKRSPLGEHESQFLLEMASIDLGDWQIRHKNPRNDSGSLDDPPDYYVLVFERDGCDLHFYHHAQTRACRIEVNGEEVYSGEDARLTELWERILSFGRMSETDRKYARAAQTIRHARETPRVTLPRT